MCEADSLKNEASASFSWFNLVTASKIIIHLHFKHTSFNGEPCSISYSLREPEVASDFTSVLCRISKYNRILNRWRVLF